MNRILLFGGTFDPFHKGHKHLTIEIQKIYNFNKVYFIPSKTPPHKQGKITADYHRLNMIKLAISDLDKDIFLISDYELNNNETSYTYNTLKHFNNFYHPQELFFLVGSDIFATIETWHKWDKLFELSNFIIVNRPNHPFSKMIKEIPELLREKIIDSNDFIFGMTNKIILTKIKEVPISSTQIRESIKTGFYKDFLDEKVYKYIIENRLYQEV